MNEYNKGYDEGFQQGLAASEFTDGYWLRCYAGQAMQGMIMNNQGPTLPFMNSEPVMEHLVSGATRYAAALLEEVKKHG